MQLCTAVLGKNMLFCEINDTEFSSDMANGHSSKLIRPLKNDLIIIRYLSWIGEPRLRPLLGFSMHRLQ